MVIMDLRGRAPLAAYEVKTGEAARMEAANAVRRIHRLGAQSWLSKPEGEATELPGVHESLGPRELAEIAMEAASHSLRGQAKPHSLQAKPATPAYSCEGS